MHSYKAAKELLDLRKRQGHLRAKLHKNVYLEWRWVSLAVKYYDTDIVTYYPDGRIELRNSGFQTVTTKQNINSFSPFHVYQREGVWYVSAGPDRDKVKFENGMILETPEGVIAVA